MIGFYLLAAHMAGDYLFQSTRMAAGKLGSARIRAEHVSVYVFCFAPIAYFYAGFPGWRAPAFLALLWAAHFATDSKRWRTTNPWPAMPILQDQSLHAVQIAVLGALFL